MLPIKIQVHIPKTLFAEIYMSITVFVFNTLFYAISMFFFANMQLLYTEVADLKMQFNTEKGPFPEHDYIPQPCPEQ